MLLPSRDEIVDTMLSLDFAVFDGEYDLNLVALRAIPGTPDRFDDTFVCFHRHGIGWDVASWPCTTDPGLPSLRDPTRREGSAVLMAPHQYRAAYALGLHRGRSECLVPVGTMPVWRDGNRDDVVDYGGDEYTSEALQVHAGPETPDRPVGPWSAGCCVVVAPGMRALLKSCHKQIEHGHGARFSLTVLPWFA